MSSDSKVLRTRRENTESSNGMPALLGMIDYGDLVARADILDRVNVLAGIHGRGSPGEKIR